MFLTNINRHFPLFTGKKRNTLLYRYHCLSLSIFRPRIGGQSQHRVRTPSPVFGAVGRQPIPSPSATGAGSAPPSSTITVWDMNQLSPFDAARGDIVLGKGSFGTVRLVRHKATRTPLAVKTFYLPSDPDQMVGKIQAIQHEADVQAVLGKIFILNISF